MVKLRYNGNVLKNEGALEPRFMLQKRALKCKQQKNICKEYTLSPEAQRLYDQMFGDKK